MSDRRPSCAGIASGKFHPIVRDLRDDVRARRSGRGGGVPCRVDALEPRVLLSAYYVSTTGSDSAAGTAAAPWRTLQKAADSARAGDVVTVRAGTYSQGMNFFGKTGGTQSAPITFTAESGVVVTGVGLGTNASMAAINVESTGGWYVIEGFTVRGNSTMQRAGIRAALSPNTVIRNNTVTGAFDGIFASRSDGVVVEGNVCGNATDEHGIYVNGSRNYVIRGNECYGNNWDGIHVNVSDGVNTINDGGLIEGNRVRGNTLAGIDVDGATNLTIRNNLSYANAKHGITVYNANQNPTPVSRNVTVVNNTLADNDMYGLQVQSGNADGMTIFNNAITGNASGSINMIGSLPSTFKSDYNVLSDKRTTGQDGHSILSGSSALFVNAGAGDYHLKAGVAAVDAGISTLNGKTAPATDLEGKARPQGVGYDAGAYERTVTPPPDTTPPTLSGIMAGGVTTSAAAVTWATDEPSTSLVEYGTDTSYGSATPLDPALVTAHGVALTGLLPDTTYHYRVVSTDAAGNVATSDDFTFTTGAPADQTAPLVESAVFNDDTPAHSVVVRFSEPVTNVLSPGALSLGNETTGTTFDPADLSAEYDDASRTLTLTLASGGVLPDGRYVLQLNAAVIKDAAGNALDGDASGVSGGDYRFTFTHLAGDANHDGVCDFTDLLTLAQNYNTTGRTFGEGDFTYDGAVNFADLLALAKNYNTTVNPVPQAGAAATAPPVTAAAAVAPSVATPSPDAATAPAVTSAATPTASPARRPTPATAARPSRVAARAASPHPSPAAMLPSIFAKRRIGVSTLLAN